MRYFGTPPKKRPHNPGLTGPTGPTIILNQVEPAQTNPILLSHIDNLQSNLDILVEEKGVLDQQLSILMKTNQDLLSKIEDNSKQQAIQKQIYEKELEIKQLEKVELKTAQPAKKKGIVPRVATLIPKR